MQVGMTKNQSLYNKPSAAVHPGALVAGTLPQYNTIQYHPNAQSIFVTFIVFLLHVSVSRSSSSVGKFVPLLKTIWCYAAIHYGYEVTAT